MPVESDADLLGMFDAEEFGVAAVWHPGWARDWPRAMVLDLEAETASLTTDGAAVVVMRDNPAGVVAGGGLGAIADRLEVILPVAALPVTPSRQDILLIEGAIFMVEQAETSIDRALWLLTLSVAEQSTS